jgi:hypothetical protein
MTQMSPEREVLFAERIARRVHAGQTKRTGDPVIRHVERVVALVDAACHAQVTAVAWLHDVLERSDLTADALLAEGISPEVAEAVRLLTRADEDDYETYIERVRTSGNALAITVKFADLRDHIGPDCAPARRPRYERALDALDPLHVASFEDRPAAPASVTCPHCWQPAALPATDKLMRIGSTRFQPTLAGVRCGACGHDLELKDTIEFTRPLAMAAERLAPGVVDGLTDMQTIEIAHLVIREGMHIDEAVRQVVEDEPGAPR